MLNLSNLAVSFNTNLSVKPAGASYTKNTSFNNTHVTKNQYYAIMAKNTRLYTPSPTMCPAPTQTALPTLLVTKTG